MRTAWFDTGYIVSQDVEVRAEGIVSAGNITTKNLPSDVLATEVLARFLRPIPASRHGL